jgi:hypothetical protein
MSRLVAEHVVLRDYTGSQGRWIILVQCNDGSCRVAKTDLSQLKCCVIAARKTDQEGNTGVVGLSVAEANFRMFSR